MSVSGGFAAQHEFTMIAALSPKDWRNAAKEATPLLFNRVCRKHQRCYVIVLIGVSAWDELRGADSLKPDSSRLLWAFFAFAHLARQFSFTLQMTVGEHSLQAHSFFGRTALQLATEGTRPLPRPCTGEQLTC
jgi:hypothetical protein